MTQIKNSNTTRRGLGIPHVPKCNLSSSPLLLASLEVATGMAVPMMVQVLCSTSTVSVCSAGSLMMIFQGNAVTSS